MPEPTSTLPEPTLPASDPVADPVADLELRLRQTEELLAQAREALSASERKRQIDRELAAHGAADLETAALLTEAAVAGMEGADVAAAVADLKRRKPFLFETPRRPATSAMSGEPAPGTPGSVEEAEALARQTGDRRALLRYLQLRRGS